MRCNCQAVSMHCVLRCWSICALNKLKPQSFDLLWTCCGLACTTCLIATCWLTLSHNGEYYVIYKLAAVHPIHNKSSQWNLNITRPVLCKDKARGYRDEGREKHRWIAASWSLPNIGFGFIHVGQWKYVNFNIKIFALWCTLTSGQYLSVCVIYRIEQSTSTTTWRLSMQSVGLLSLKN